MGLGSTAKKIQTVAETAEKLYAKVNEMREEVDRMRETLSTTEARVERVESDLAGQRALLAALAEQQGVDVDSVLSDLEEPADPDEGPEEEGAADGADAADGTDGSAA